MKNCFYLLLVLTLFACQNENEQVQEQNEKDSTELIETTEEVLERYPNGLKKVEGIKVNGERHGKWIFYYDNGMKWSEGHYRYGERDGHSIVYYENGKKKIEGNYDDDLRVGIWKVWNDDGTFVTEVDMNEKLSKSDSLKLEMK